MTIEKINETDGAAMEKLRGLLREYANYVRSAAGPEHICLAAYENELQRLPSVYFLMLVALEEQDLAGCALLKRVAVETGEPACEMKRLWVAPSFRGRGLGRSLVTRLMDEARAGGFTSMYLDTIPSQMAEAAALYRTLGFEPVEPYNANQDAHVEHFRVCLSRRNS